jgi:hypothetical protein
MDKMGLGKDDDFEQVLFSINWFFVYDWFFIDTF